MTIVRRFPPFNGIDLSKTEVMRNEQSLSDALNMKFDLTGRYVKRGGFEELSYANNIDAPFLINGLGKRYGKDTFDFYWSKNGIFTGQAIDLSIPAEVKKGDEDFIEEIVSLSPNTPNESIYVLNGSILAEIVCVSEHTFNDIDGLESQSHVNLGGNKYIASISGDIYRYDGQSVSLAGLQDNLPLLSITSSANPIAPDNRPYYGMVAGNYYWKYRLKKVDNQFNITYSKFSAAQGDTIVAAQLAQIGLNLYNTIDNNDENRQWRTATAKTTSAHPGGGSWIISVEDNPTILVGDMVPVKIIGTTGATQDSMAYLKVDAVVLTPGSSSISLANGFGLDGFSGTFKVFKDENLTNGLTYELYRTKIGGSVIDPFYRVAEFNNIKTNISTLQTLSYEYESKNDSALIELLDEAVNTSTGKLPPGRILGYHQDSLVILGIDGKTIHWSSSSSYEAFSVGNNAIIGSDDEGFIRGFKSNNNGLIVIKDRAVYYIHGSLGDGNFEVRKAPSNVGGLAHHSMIEIGGNIIFLGDQGLFATSLGAMPVEIGKPINKKLIELRDKLNFNLAVAIDWRKERLYVLSIPYDTSLPNVPVDPLTVVYDYFNGGWFIWESLSIIGGAVEDGSDFIFTPEKRPDIEVNKSKPMLYLPTTYRDINKAINAKLVTAWEHGGAPGFEKKFQNLKIFSVSTDEFVMSVFTDEEYLAVDDPITNFEELEFVEGDASNVLPIKDGKTDALRVTFENNNTNEAMTIDGWEMEYEIVSDRLKP